MFAAKTDKKKINKLKTRTVMVVFHVK